MCVWLILITFTFNAIETHYYMAGSGMRELSKLDKDLSKSFLDYYYEEMKKLDDLEIFLDSNDEVLLNRSKSKEDMYFLNAVDGYKLIKRFTRQWVKFPRFQRPKFLPPILDQYLTFINKVKGFKDLTEMRGSVYAILKIQETYRINVTQFTEGYNNYSQKLKLQDVFLIGYYAMNLHYYEISKLWLVEAYNRHRLENDKDLHPYNFTRLVESLIWSCHQMKDFESASYYSERLAELHPRSRVVKGKVLWYKYQLNRMKRMNGPKITNRDTNNAFALDNRPWLKRQNIMCRGEERMRQKDVNKLSCSYYRPNYEFYFKPMKLEIAYDNPRLLYFHNLLSPAEVDDIIAKSRGQLAEAEVFSLDSGELTTAEYRISKSAWFSGWYDYMVHNIIKRVGRITNLNMDYSEPLQVSNYGIGGNYESHFDHASPPHNSSIFGKYNWGNRVATMLIYLSDVEGGGDTVFVNTGPGVIIPPKKGAGVFWYNLKRNGKGDEATKHAACPVLLGEKWVANIWIHEWGQELVRPCSLNPEV